MDFDFLIGLAWDGSARNSIGALGARDSGTGPEPCSKVSVLPWPSDGMEMVAGNCAKLGAFCRA